MFGCHSHRSKLFYHSIFFPYFINSRYVILSILLCQFVVNWIYAFYSDSDKMSNLIYMPFHIMKGFNATEFNTNLCVPVFFLECGTLDLGTWAESKAELHRRRKRKRKKKEGRESDRVKETEKAREREGERDGGGRGREQEERGERENRGRLYKIIKHTK